MAQTVLGSRLTRSYQTNNSGIASEVARNMRDPFALLDPYSVWETADEWLLEATKVIGDGYRASQTLSDKYVHQFAVAEGFRVPKHLERPAMNVAKVRSDLAYWGPLMIMEKTSQGMDPGVAKQSMLLRLQGVASNAARDGGRGVVIGAAKVASPKRVWRRITTSAEPCAFCAMLATKDFTGSTKGAVEFEAHPGCGCEAELVTEDTVLSPLEKKWNQSYLDAAKAVDKQGLPRNSKNILHEMRLNSPTLYRDGVFPKKQ